MQIAVMVKAFFNARCFERFTRSFTYVFKQFLLKKISSHDYYHSKKSRLSALFAGIILRTWSP